MSLPQIASELSGEVYSYRQPNLTYRLGESTVNGKIDRLEAIKQAVRHILMTERWSNPIYDDNYGIELEQYIGKDFGFIVADIQQTLQDALLQDDRIKDVLVTDVSKSTEQQNACIVKFTVYTIYGDYTEEIDVVQ